MTAVETQWWGYLHKDGGGNVKRYWGKTSDGDLEEARSSDFVACVIGPFEAGSREEALEVLRGKLLERMR